MQCQLADSIFLLPPMSLFLSDITSHKMIPCYNRIGLGRRGGMVVQVVHLPARRKELDVMERVEDGMVMLDGMGAKQLLVVCIGTDSKQAG